MPRGSAHTLAFLAAAAIVLVVSVPAATSGTRQVSHEDPSWAPNGRTIAFVVQPSGTSGPQAVAVVAPNGTGMRRVTPYMTAVSWPTWSPDSRRLAFVSYTKVENGDPSIYTVTAAGAGLHTIGNGFHPEWSPGGRKIAYNTSTLDDSVGDIMVVSPDGFGRRRAAASTVPTAYEMPTWSPDGQRLAFVATAAPDQPPPANTPFLASIQQYGGRIRLLSRAHALEPDWSPDGRRIAFTFRRDTTSGAPPTPEIRVLDLRTQRTTFVHAGRHPRWSPDGRKLVFVSGQPPLPSQIYVMNADGSNVRQLTR